MAATATPGFPIVVTTFTKGSSRPAAAPESTLMLAFTIPSVLAVGAPRLGDTASGAAALAATGTAAPALAPAGLAIGGTMPGLMIMVFSKVAPGASLMNLILYLPIST